MRIVVEYLAIILPVVALIFILVFLLFSIYSRIRRLIPINVNCWFCNQWTKVDYDNRNCFDCPKCLQYNGFSSDGGYNRPISAQFDELLNRDVTYNQHGSKSSHTVTNGLCLSCNNNLRLKVFQLANFVPLNENNFDAEIEHFEQQLDKSYKLCIHCEMVVKATLRKQNELLGIKLPNLRRKGIRLLNFNNYSKGNRTIVIKAIAFVLVTIACCNIIYILSRFDYSNDNLRKVTPQRLYPYIIRLKEYGIDAQNAIQHFFSNTFSNNQINFLSRTRKDIDFEYNAKLLCCLGILLQLILVFLSEGGRTQKLIQIVAWGLLTWFSWNYPVLDFNYNNYAQIVTNLVIIASWCITWNSKIKPKKLKRKSSHKIKYPKTINKENSLNDSNNVKKEIPKMGPQEHFTEFSKPHFMSGIKALKSDVQYNDPLYMYNTNRLIERPPNFQDDIVTNLTKLHLGRSPKLSDNYENPFLKIRTPLYQRNTPSCQLISKSYSHSNNKFVLPSAPSSFTLKVQFSTRNSKF